MDKTPSALTWASINGDPPFSAARSTHRSMPDQLHHRQDHTSLIPLPQHQPHSSIPNDDLHVLTLLTDKSHHSRLTSPRKRYFPSHLNKLSAHLTLFHALPGSKLQSTIIPDLQRLARRTSPFQIRATGPFRMKRGIVVGLARDEEGCEKAQEVHQVLQAEWKEGGWLSEQDAEEGWRGHYTVMNKVDEERTVAMAFIAVKQGWEDDIGTVEGLELWKYGKGGWKWERRFDFQGK